MVRTKGGHDMYANTFRLYYRQGASNFYTVGDFGDLVYVNLDALLFVIAGRREIL